MGEKRNVMLPDIPTVAEAGVPVTKAQVRMRVPLWLKLVYTAFMAVLVHWHNYGPTHVLAGS